MIAPARMRIIELNNVHQGVEELIASQEKLV